MTTIRSSVGLAAVAVVALLAALSIDAVPSVATAQPRATRAHRARARRRSRRPSDTAERAAVGVPEPDAAPELRPREDRGALELALTTHVPIAIGASLYVRPPVVPLFLRVFVGWAPAPYVDAVDGVLTDARLYERALSPHVRALATGTTMASLSLGLTHQVLDLAAGYTLLHRAARVPRELVARAIAQNGLAPPGLEERLPPALPAEIAVHMVHVELGARMVAFDHLVVRVDLRWDHAIAANTEVSIDAGGEVDVESGIGHAEDRVEAQLGTFTFFPSLAVSLGYQF